MPLYVRAGSILPVGPAIQYSGQPTDGSLTLHVFTGANGSFSLYEDDGTSRQYLRGAFSRIPISWNQATGRLTIGAREGGFPGMAQRREIRIVWYGPGRPRPFDADGRADATLVYDGRAQSVLRAAR